MFITILEVLRSETRGENVNMNNTAKEMFTAQTNAIAPMFCDAAAKVRSKRVPAK